MAFFLRFSRATFFSLVNRVALFVINFATFLQRFFATLPLIFNTALLHLDFFADFALYRLTLLFGDVVAPVFLIIND